MAHDEAPPRTSKQQLAAVIKRVRDRLREDAGLSTDAERLPQLTWMFFLKLLDDHERAREERAGPARDPILEEPYRWRDWAPAGRVPAGGLLDFVNNRLFPYLARRCAPRESDLRSVVGKVFRGIRNLVRSGDVLREVVAALDGIPFRCTDDVHLVSHFYETILRELRDASGTSGEFYTPRPLVRFIIDRLRPRPGERVLDPACGTCGFLVEAYAHLRPQARTPAARQKLQGSLLGIEKKTMPYLLGVVNLLLHGVEEPAVVEGNALAAPLDEIRDGDRVEVIATNPPFGGEEEEGILANFPADLRTKETAVLFFQYVMARLRRPGGRCGIVLPNGFLFGTGAAAEVRKRLLDEFNLHTVVRLPEGVFAPYTNIPTNVLFFESRAAGDGAPGTREVWFYEHLPPEGRRGYTKKRPLALEDFGTLMAWWDRREENEHAWRVPVEQLLAGGCNLDLRNPSRSQARAAVPAEELLERIVAKQRRVLELMDEIKGLLGSP